jgi:hypothetical protein
VWSLSARQDPPHAGAVLVGLWQQFDAMTLERRDNLRPHLSAHMPVAAFFGDVELATNLEAMHGSHGDAGGLGELGDGELG